MMSVRTVVCGVSCLMLAAVQATAKEAGPAKAAALLKQMRAACGGANWDKVRGWHETGRVDLPNGMSARHDAWSDMRLLKTASKASVDGRTMRHVGFDGASVWSLRRDGSVERSAEKPAIAKQRRDAYISSFGYFLPKRFPARAEWLGNKSNAGKNYQVIRMTPRGAAIVDIWIDPQTHLVARFEADGEHADLSDYRTFDGVCTATTGRQGGSDPARTIVLHIEAVDTGPVPAATFSPPAK
jgi:hypothetical protein